jgi:hypothetical protein
MLSIKSNGAGVLPVEGLQKSHQPITGTILIADDQAYGDASQMCAGKYPLNTSCQGIITNEL